MNNDIKILAGKYITGQASEEEKRLVKQWIRESPENEAYYVQLYETWQDSMHARPDLIDTDLAYRKFISKVEPGRLVYRSLNNKWVKIAAAALVVFICTLGVYYYNSRNDDSQAKWLIVKVANGKTRKIILPDGSIVWINAGSSLKYKKDFNLISRDVYLSGEAYFDIAPSKKNIPFLVQTDHFVIHDIGTVFNIKAYPDGSLFEAAVFEGKVSVEGRFGGDPEEKSKVFLSEKQVIRINTDKLAGKSGKRAGSQDVKSNINELVKVVEVTPSQIDEYKGWKDNFLVFDGDTFQQIARDLERRYDVKIAFKSSELQDYKYSGSFRDIKDINTVLEIIKKTTPIDYTIKGTEITIGKAN